MHEHIVADTDLRDVFQADALEDAADLDLAHQHVLFANYLLCAILAAIAGLVVVGGTNAADLSLADSYLLPSVACVVIGGTSIFGGRGGYAGTIIGALILTVLTGLLTLLDVSEPIKQILYGAIILSLAAAYARLTE